VNGVSCHLRLDALRQAILGFLVDVSQEHIQRFRQIGVDGAEALDLVLSRRDPAQKEFS
jgi:hypothetical protein